MAIAAKIKYYFFKKFSFKIFHLVLQTLIKKGCGEKFQALHIPFRSVGQKFLP